MTLVSPGVSIWVSAITAHLRHDLMSQGRENQGVRDTSMGMAKLVGKLEKFPGLSKKKQRKKYSRLVKIIDMLEKKQDCLQAEMGQEPDSKRYHDLIRKLDVISELIAKAKLKDCSD